jgi:hypothetical protein
MWCVGCRLLLTELGERYVCVRERERKRERRRGESERGEDNNRNPAGVMCVCVCLYGRERERERERERKIWGGEKERDWVCMCVVCACVWCAVDARSRTKKQPLRLARNRTP